MKRKTNSYARISQHFAGTVMHVSHIRKIWKGIFGKWV
jgi:hypothetical protein